MTTAQSAHLKKAFLDHFATTGNISLACIAAKIGRRTVYEWQEHDTEFLLEYRQAEIQAVEALEAEAWRRAVTGTKRPVYQGGKLVGYVREVSDTLLIFLLKARAPEKYRERFDVTRSDVPAIKSYSGIDLERV